MVLQVGFVVAAGWVRGGCRAGAWGCRLGALGCTLGVWGCRPGCMGPKARYLRGVALEWWLGQLLAGVSRPVEHVILVPLCVARGMRGANHLYPTG